MIRRYSLTLALLCCPGPAAAEPACLYESKSYSDGAFLCVQKSLMLTCSSDGARATWKFVADREISERCVTPTVLNYPPAPRRHARRMHAVRHRTEPAQQASAKCFSFNNKQYCE